MLSRAQEARVRDFLGRQLVGAGRTYCLEHLAMTVQVPAAHLADLAAFVRGLREHGDCMTRYGGRCDAEQHETKHLVVWGPLPQQTAERRIS